MLENDEMNLTSEGLCFSRLTLGYLMRKNDYFARGSVDVEDTRNKVVITSFYLLLWRLTGSSVTTYYFLRKLVISSVSVTLHYSHCYLQIWEILMWAISYGKWLIQRSWLVLSWLVFRAIVDDIKGRQPFVNVNLIFQKVYGQVKQNRKMAKMLENIKRGHFFTIFQKAL